MSYRVLARKYRSQTLNELIGQQPIVTTLRNALESGRIHHGYLFCGTRGVGKTSMARILAKALNCHSADGPTASPCNTCESCVAIGEGQDLDVIEIDAASNTGVDHIRELRNNAAFRPARSRFKIYIIDEVHMLSTGAFNALLKTLEEPPDHVKFIFATTESHKVPATIQSRCLRFDFRSIGIAEIVEQLERIVKAEGATADPAAIRRVARLANGSMRDALSILDQLLSIGGDNLDAALLEQVLPAPQDELMPRLMDRIAESDAAGALGVVDESLAGGLTPDRFCETLIDHIRTLMLLRVCGSDTELVDLPMQGREERMALAERFDDATYVYMIALLEELRRTVRFSGAGRALLDAAIVRLSQSARFSAIEQLMSGEAVAAAPAALPAGAVKKKVAAEPPRAAARAPQSAQASASAGISATAIAAPPPAQTAQRAPAITKPSPPPPRRRLAASDAERSQALSDPIVRKAIDMFEGSLENVERLADPPTTDASPDDA